MKSKAKHKLGKKKKIKFEEKMSSRKHTGAKPHAQRAGKFKGRSYAKESKGGRALYTAKPEICERPKGSPPLKSNKNSKVVQM